MGSVRRRRWARAVAVGALGPITVAACTSAAAHATHPSAASPPAPAPIVGWSRSTAAALDLGGGATSTLSAVIAPQEAGGDWTIAGTRIAADGTTTATVWSSPDGVRWRSSALAGADGRALAASAWGTRTVIVGSVGRGTTERAAVWTTQGPGQAFALIPSDAAMQATSASGAAGPSGPPTTGTGTGNGAGAGTGTGTGTETGTGTGTGTASMDVVGAGTQGVFAAGSVLGRQAVWYSTDGTDWVRLAGAERLMGDAGAQVTSMLVTPGAVLLAGTVADGTQTDGAIWTSADGINWHRFATAANPFVGAGSHRINGLALDSTGSLIAVGAVRSGPSWVPASWISPNGGTWSQASEALPTSTQPQPGRGGSEVRAVAMATAPGLVAVGGSSTAQRVWTSLDGQNWTETRLPAAAARASDWSADLVATDGTTTVVVDRTAGQPRVLVGRRHVWQEVSARPAPFGPVAAVATPAALVTDAGRLLLAVDIDRPGQAIGATTSSVDLLSSSDGTHWTLLSADRAFAGGRVDAMSEISGSLVAVGTSTRRAGGSSAAVWTSPTGRSWQRAGVAGGVSAAPEAVTTVGILGSALLATGTGPAASIRAATVPAVDATPVALTWSSSLPVGDGAIWAPAGPLDAAPSPAAERPLGACSDGRRLVVVGDGTRRGVAGPRRPPVGPGRHATTTLAAAGSPTGPDGQVADGTVADAWATTTGTSWVAGTVSPLSGAGGREVMDGCSALAPGFIAWGQASSPQGLAAPALWSSTDGVTWVLEKRPTLTIAGSAPLTDLATSGQEWIAVSGGAVAATASPSDPSGTVDDPSVAATTPPASSGPDGSAGVWSSGDGGQTWTRARTDGDPWASGGRLSTEMVGILGPAIVVVGQVDGRLAAWVGAVSG